MREMVKAEDVSRRMKMIRTAKGLSCKSVGQIMGKTGQAVSSQERNPLSLSVATLMKYAEVYGCEVSDFFVPSDFAESKI